jgi:hypothetical protein
MKKNISKHLDFAIISACLLILPITSACQSLPQLFSSAEQVMDDNAVKIEIQKEAINQNTNISVTLDVTNKEVSNATVEGKK